MFITRKVGMNVFSFNTARIVHYEIYPMPNGFTYKNGEPVYDSAKEVTFYLAVYGENGSRQEIGSMKIKSTDNHYMALAVFPESNGRKIDLEFVRNASQYIMQELIEVIYKHADYVTKDGDFMIEAAIHESFKLAYDIERMKLANKVVAKNA